MNIIVVSFLLCTIGVVAGELGDENHHHSTWGVIGLQDKLLRRDVLTDDPSVSHKTKATYSFPSSVRIVVVFNIIKSYIKLNYRFFSFKF